MQARQRHTAATYASARGNSRRGREEAWARPEIQPTTRRTRRRKKGAPPASCLCLSVFKNKQRPTSNGRVVVRALLVLEDSSSASLNPPASTRAARDCVGRDIRKEGAQDQTNEFTTGPVGASAGSNLDQLSLPVPLHPCHRAPSGQQVVEIRLCGRVWRSGPCRLRVHQVLLRRGQRWGRRGARGHCTRLHVESRLKKKNVVPR